MQFPVLLHAVSAILAFSICLPSFSTPTGNATPASSLHAATEAKRHRATIQAILEQPQGKIDLALSKVTIDQMITPASASDIKATLAQIDAMAQTVRNMLPQKASLADKIQTLRQYLYVAGPWNNYAPYQYDFDDPRGTKNLAGANLSHYLATKKGQCISMPLLFIVLAERLNMAATLALAPNHAFVMYKDDIGSWRKLETTSDGGPISVASLQRNFPMSQKAIANGAYLKPLNKRETVVAMSLTLLEFYKRSGQPEEMIRLAEVISPYQQNSIEVLLFHSIGYKAVVRRDFMSKYPTSNDIPREQYARFNELVRRSLAFEDMAFALGFQPPPDEAANASYMETVNQAKMHLEPQGAR